LCGRETGTDTHSFNIVTVLRAERPEFGSVEGQPTYPMGTGGAFPTGYHPSCDSDQSPPPPSVGL